jgi:glutathione S-transferase
MEYGSNLLGLIAAFYNAPDDTTLRARAADIRNRFEQLEAALGEGPWFDGAFSLVDAVFGPVLRYFDVFDEAGDFGFWNGLPKLQAWREALAARPSVQAAAHPQYDALLRNFLIARGSALSPPFIALASNHALPCAGVAGQLGTG